MDTDLFIRRGPKNFLALLYPPLHVLKEDAKRQLAEKKLSLEPFHSTSLIPESCHVPLQIFKMVELKNGGSQVIAIIGTQMTTKYSVNSLHNNITIWKKKSIKATFYKLRIFTSRANIRQLVRRLRVLDIQDMISSN